MTDSMNAHRMRKIMAVTMVALMMFSGMAVMLDGSDDSDASSATYNLYGMGSNTFGQQGDGTTTDVTTPTQIGSTMGNIVSVESSFGTTFFITEDKKLYGMGANTYGQLGTGNTNGSVVPIQIGANLGNIESVISANTNESSPSRSFGTTYFITEDKKLYGMGVNVSGNLGTGNTTNTYTPVQIGNGLGNIIYAVAGVSNTTQSSETGCVLYFITEDKKLYGLGWNAHGQQGDGTTTNVTTPTQIGSTLGNIVYVTCSSTTVFFITEDKKLYGMGANTYGQQGDGTTTDVTTPTQIGSNVSSVFCSALTTFYITEDKKLYGMGANSNGQQGDGTTTNVTTPTQIGSNVSSVFCSALTTFYITEDKYAYGSGANSNGQQGDGTTTNVKSFKRVGSSLGNISSVYVSNTTTFLQTESGELYGCGNNGSGQIGIGNTNSPVTSFQLINSGLGPVLSIALAEQTETSENNNSKSKNPVKEQDNTDVKEKFSKGAVDALFNSTFFITTYTTLNVTIFSNNSEYGSVDETSLQVPSGTSVTIADNVLTIGSATVTATPTTSTAEYTYAFSSWSGVSDGDTITTDTTITANFTRTLNTYTVTISPNDNSYGSVSQGTVTSVPYGTSISANDNVLTVGTTDITATPSANTDNYTYAFDGWTGLTENMTVSGDTTITATFERTVRQYTITWKIDNQTETQLVDYGTTPTHADPTKPGYVFNGWDPEIETVSGDATYTATWLKLYTATLQYNSMGGQNTPTAQTYTGTDLTDHTFTITMDVPTKSNSAFAGWGVTNSDTEPTYQPGDTIDVAYNGTVTLYAVWLEPNFVLKFNVGGGSNGPATMYYYSESDETHDFTIPDTEPTWWGHDFSGWSSTPNGEVEYDPSDTVTVDADETVTLYAIYERTGTGSAIGSMIDILPLLMIVGLILGLLAVVFYYRTR